MGAGDYQSNDHDFLTIEYLGLVSTGTSSVRQIYSN